MKCNRQQSMDKMAYLKVISLFSRLYIAMQHRESDMSKFFSHENQPFPPSLSGQGKLHFGKKSDLLEVLVHDIHSEPPDTIFTLDSLMELLWYTYYPLSMLRAFDEYADKIFLPHISKQLESCTRVDIVWDKYIPNSIKESTREKRGKGIQRKVEGKNKLPGKWADFLHDATNKQELFGFISKKVAAMHCPAK